MTDAEILVDFARALAPKRPDLLVVEGADERLCAIADLSLRLADRSAVVLRAIVEDWPRERIVRELY